MKLLQALMHLLKKFGIKANKIELSANDILNLLAGNEINIGSKRITLKSDNFSVDASGKMVCNHAVLNNVTINNGNIKMQGNGDNPTIYIEDGQNCLEVYSSNFNMIYDYDGTKVSQFLQKGGYYVEAEGSSSKVWYNGITTPVLNQTSLAEQKKNFEKLENALEIIKNVDIYKYNLKNEKDGTKKHIGFVIGDKYRYSKELTSQENDGVDLYSLASCCLKGIKEQQEQIEQLKKKIKKIKEGN